MQAWIPYLQNPLVFFSFILLLLIGFIKAFLRSKKLTRNASTTIINKVLNGTFIVALLVFAATMTGVFSHAPAPQIGQIKFSTSEPLVYIGSPELIFATVYDTNGKQMNDGDVNWVSLNPEVIGVTPAGNFEGEDGKVYQARLIGIAPGSALIEASRNGYSEKIQVMVSRGTPAATPLAPLDELTNK